MDLKKIKKSFLFIIFVFLFINKGFALVTVSSNADSGANTLRAALTGAAIGETIAFNLPSGSTTITLSSPLPFIVNNLTIDGTNAAGKVTINGQNLYPGFVITNGTASISELNIQNCRSKGGDGGDATAASGTGGGAGMGAGGGIFINNTASVTLSDLNFDNCSAIGGNGGDKLSSGAIFGCGGGGGLGGNGAGPGPTLTGGGGGGLYVSAISSTGVGGGGNGGEALNSATNGSDFGGGEVQEYQLQEQEMEVLRVAGAAVQI